MQEHEEIRYRFSRPVRLSAVSVGLVFFIAATVACLILRAWDGVVGCSMGVLGVGSLLAQQLGIGVRLTARFPHGPLPRLLASVVFLALVTALVAVESGNTVTPVTVAGVLAALLLVHFWWEKRRSQGGERSRR